MIGRLGPGSSRQKAKAELDALLAGFRGSLRLEAHTVLVIGTAPIERPDNKKEFRFTTKDVFVIREAPGLQQGGASAPDFLCTTADTLEASGIAPVGMAAVPPLHYGSIAARVRLPDESDSVWRQVRRPASVERLFRGPEHPPGSRPVVQRV